MTDERSSRLGGIAERHGKAKTYSQRPIQRAARRAWDHFMDKHSYLRATKRALELGYSPNVDGYGPGWILHAGSLAEDTLHWKGGKGIFYTVLCGNIKDTGKW